MKRIVALVLALILMALALPFSAFAEEASPAGQAAKGREKIEESATDYAYPRETSKIRDLIASPEEETFDLPPIAENFASSGNWEYVISSGKAKITKYTGPGGAVSVPSSLGGYTVNAIGDSAFAYCSGVTSVSLPSSVATIGEWAFEGCDAMTGINLSSVTTIGDGAFFGCISLSSVSLSSRLTVIQRGAFSACNGLKSISIPNSVTTIENVAFYSCISLTAVTIPSGVTLIGSMAFAYCNLLEKVTISHNNIEIARDAFERCDSLQYTEYEYVRYLGDSSNPYRHLIGAVSTQIDTITIHANTKVIQNGAFADCQNLWNSWEDRGAEEIYVPDGVLRIHDSAFANCRCTDDESFHIRLPDSLQYIATSAFNNAWMYGIRYYDVLYIGTSTNPYRMAFYCFDNTMSSCVLHSNTKVIGDDLFIGCQNLSNVYIPSGVTAIGDGAFYECASLTSITIPSSVTTIDDFAFAGCAGLTSVTIPKSVTTIGDYAFCDCGGLTSITIPSSVTAIGAWAFCDCEGLTSITIPSSVTTIGDGAFEDCSGLTSVTIPKSVTAIGDEAFAGCSGLRSITIPESVTAIGVYAFDGCAGLTSITIPDSVNYIGLGAFGFCDSLTSITIPSSVTAIGNAIFFGCANMTSIQVASGNPAYHSAGNCLIETTSKTLISGFPTSVIPADGSVTAIGDGAFSGFADLKQITIPDGITSIGYHAFNYCASLESISLPESISFIETSAFPSSESLKTVRYGGTKSQWKQVSIGDENECLLNAEIIFQHLNADWGQASYDWSGDLKTCTASRVCAHCGETETETVNTTKTVKSTANCTGQGEVVYTAAFQNAAFGTRTKSVYSPALGHTWGDASYKWSEDLKTCAASHTCSVCKGTETETVNATSKVTTPATEAAAGVRTYYANFKDPAFQQQTQQAPVLYSGEVTWGDANGDGVVDPKDLARLKNFFANYDPETDSSTYEIFDGADANGDGVVDPKDLARLKNYFANYDPETDASSYVLGPA